jgi:activating signal cointegrator complex subunit 2
MTVGPLSLWPSSRARESLAPSQRAALYAKIAAALADTLSLPPPKRDTLQSRSFVASYARDVALNALDALLWPDKRESRISTTEAAIRARALSLAEKLANSTSITLDVETLIDLSVAFAGSKRLRSVWTAAHASDQSLRNQIQDALVPSFVALFQPAQVTSSGLSGIRKSAHILLCLLRVLPAPLLSFFANSTSMALSVARAYDAGLGSIAVNYGGPPDPARISVLDDDQKLWLQTKVSLIDSFHILLRAHIERLANASAGSSELTIAADAAFEVIFALIEEEGGPEVLSTPQAGIPFATRGLLVDYQHVYPLSHTLQRALTKAAANDPRMDILDASLRNFDAGDRSDSGALRLLLRSSGHGPTSMITQPPPLIASSSAAANSIPEDAELEAQVAQVLDVLPDVDPSHVRALLCAPDQPFNRNTERTLESLLDGSAPSLAELQSRQDHKDKWVFTANRANIHDGEAINMSQMRKGKRTYVPPYFNYREDQLTIGIVMMQITCCVIVLKLMPLRRISWLVSTL